jgi:hypothetical protein
MSLHNDHPLRLSLVWKTARFMLIPWILLALEVEPVAFGERSPTPLSTHNQATGASSLDHARQPHMVATLTPLDRSLDEPLNRLFIQPNSDLLILLYSAKNWTFLND